jgi:hypothetical protein
MVNQLSEGRHLRLKQPFDNSLSVNRPSVSILTHTLDF